MILSPAHAAPLDRGRTAAELPWWKQTTVYQIYPRSFADGNGDGIGDLPGIIGRLDYLQSLGIETIWLSPFFQSPQVDFGYDISGHYDISPEYGSIEDCRRLIEEIHKRAMKVVLDMVLNHTSDQHPWFLESRSSRDNPRRDWYLWRNGRKPRGGAPPTNWKSMLGGSGWRWDAATDQWYWASFLPFQPDLNWRNPEVKKAMLDVVRHWLTEGADGLRLDIFNALFKDQDFANNPFSFRPIPSEDNPDGFFQQNLHTINHPDTLAFARELRSVVDEFHSPPRFLVGEVFGSTEVLREYCGSEGEGLNLVFLFKSMKTPFKASAFRSLIEEFEREFAAPLHPTWVFGNHDRPRSLQRLGDHVGRARLIAAFQLTVRGVPFIYYGDEIGMGQLNMPLSSGKDPIAAHFNYVPNWVARRLRKGGISLNRDECRPPMQWTAAKNAGFSTEHANTWLPMHPNSASINVANQSDDPASLLNCYRRFLWLRRQSPALHAGSLELMEARTHAPEILAYRRIYDPVGAPGPGGSREGHRQVAVVFLNFSSGELPVDLRPYRAEKVVSNAHLSVGSPPATYLLQPFEAIVLV